jgi:hypothetical protein
MQKIFVYLIVSPYVNPFQKQNYVRIMTNNLEGSRAILRTCKPGGEQVSR